MMRDSTIGSWLICASGFTQTLASPSGIERLWFDLRSVHERGANGVRVSRVCWNDNYDEFAEFVWRYRPPSGSPRIGVFGYSYGAGWWARKFAWACLERGITIDCMVLSDPVYRHPVLSYLGWSLLPRNRIYLPKNVMQVHYFLQRMNKPAGHYVTAADGKLPKISAPEIEYRKHQYMDDSELFHAKCHSVAKVLAA